MIDKTIPYYNLIMRYDGPVVSSPPLLPQGFSFRSYQDGDEFLWARMEVVNNDFDTYENAVAYFKKTYLSAHKKLENRFVGVTDSRGVLCGSVICWDDLYASNTPERISSLHWLICDPSVKDRELGTALVQMTLHTFSEMHALPVYLHTQPWSYKAVGIYYKCGFRPLSTESFRGYKNQSAEAICAMRNHIPENLFQQLASAIALSGK